MKLQPMVAISDVYSTTEMRLRLMGTGIVTMTGQDETGSGLEKLYSEPIRMAMGKLAWEIVSRPVGYLCSRRMKTASGRFFDIPSINLPLANPKSARNVAITYVHVPKAEFVLAARDQTGLIEALDVTHWIDLGAGVPG